MDWWGADVYVDVAWGDAPLTADASCTWVDESAYLRHVSTNRGRSSELSNVSPGTMSCAFDNSTRRFDPTNTAGAHYGELLPMTKIRFRAGAGSTLVVFSGFVLGWPITYPGMVDSVVRVQCVDAMRVLEQSACPGSAYGSAVLVSDPDHYWPMQQMDGVQLWPAAGESDLVSRFTSVGYFDPNTTTTLPVGEPVMMSSGTGNVVPQLASLPTAISAWIYDPGAAAVGSPYYYAATAASTWIFVFFCASEIRVTYSDATANKRNVATSGDYSIVKWLSLAGLHAHVAVTFSSTSIVVYLNGQPYTTIATEAGTRAVPAGSGGAASVGIYGADPATPPEASIAHAAIWTTSTPTAADILAHYEAGVFAHGHPMGERTGTRIGRILDAIGWPTADRAISTGSTVCGQWEPNGASALSQIRALEDLEQGLFYIAADGKATFRDRNWLRVNSRAITARYTYGDGPGEIGYDDVEIDGNHLEHIRNTITVSYPGASVTVKDATSRAAYGVQSDSIDAGDLPTWGGWVAQQAGRYRLRARKNPTTRIPMLKVDPRAGALATTLPSVVDLDLGDRVTVIRRPDGATDPIEVDCHVQGISHDVDPGRWSTTLYLAPAVASYVEGDNMLVGDATYGIVGDGHLIAY